MDRLQTQTDVFGLMLTFSYDATDRRTLVQDSKGGYTTSVFTTRINSRAAN